MALNLDSISAQDRAWLSSQITSKTTPEQIRELAQRLLTRMLNDDNLVTQAEIEVQRLVNLLRQSEANQEAARLHQYYQFGSKHHSSSPEHTTFRQFKVHDYDLGKFCEFFGLSETQMVRVAKGQILEHRGWRQGYTPGNLGKRYEGDPRAFGIFISGLIKGSQSVPNSAGAIVFLPSEWWTPPVE